jgi:outer membrane phospholipase A
LLTEGQQVSKPYSPEQFFREHFHGYEPVYFVAGSEIPNAKFQISLRYQLLNNDGALARHAPFLKGLSVAYTQTSLWDLNSPSAPFFDSSYKPEMLYVYERVDGGKWGDWVRLDLQGGLQHESNGKAGTDSRSLNIGYFRPRLTLGRADGFQFAIQPRVWGYVGDLTDNPDIKDYRGYGDLRLTAGWARGAQLSATGRIGDDWRNGAVQLDLTYPMMRLLSGSFSVYLHAQYFNGYGESLLEYNERGDAFRIGFALYR